MTVRRLGLCLGTALALAVVGCTGERPLPSPSTTEPVSANAVRDINPVPRERVRDGGLLRAPLAVIPTQWNPRHPDADSDDARRLFAPLAPAHFSMDAAGRVAPNPDFITAAEANHAGPTVVTLRLNEAAVWGDAQPITADDWVATWRASVGEVPGIAPNAVAGWDRIAEVRAGASPGEVVVTYRAVDPDWAEPLVGGPMRAASVADAESFSWSRPSPTDLAGPFLVASVDALQGLVTLERNPLWWGDRPKLEQVMFRMVQPQALAAAFQHNELDVWETGPSAERRQQTRAAADTTLRTAPGRWGRTVRISTDGVLAEPGVRKAVLMALDRGAVASNDVEDAPAPPLTWSNGLVLPTQPGYVDQARATGLAHDPAQAAHLLDEAGWAEASGRRTKGTQRLSLTFAARPEDPLARTEFSALSGQLERIGVDLAAVSSDADLTPTTVPVSPFPLAHLPRSALANPQVADQVGRVAHEVDPVRRADQASQLARLLWQDVTEIPLYQMPQFVAVRNGVANLGAPGYSTTDWEDVGWTS